MIVNNLTIVGMFKPLLIIVKANGFPQASYTDLYFIVDALIAGYYESGTFPFDISPYNITSL